MSTTSHKRNQGAVQEVSQHPVAFAAAFLVFFLIAFGFLNLVGATPDPLTDTSAAVPVNEVATAPTNNPEAPVRVVAKDINLDVAVVNPTSTSTSVLDDALTHGALRYPTSNELGVNGTVVLFGHSSYLPVVYHQYYKTFDGIQDLKTGAIVSVFSSTTEYRYSVTGVSVEDATSDVINLPQDGQHLTLVTCNSFEDTSKRFVVTADFVGAYQLAQ
jgi:LPXTG-site transpeptidase (sortase) family protein